MFKKFADGFQSTLAQAGEQAKARNGIPGLGGSSSPRQSASIDRPPIMTNGSGHVPFEEGNLDSDNEEDTTKQPGQTSDADNPEARKSLTIEQSPDLQKRLNKLSKYEKKYPELLRAYRALQTQDLHVKSFEKVLGEITPATSILDVEAFQQWANNFTLRANMSIEELRRVSKEMEVLQADAKARALQSHEETSALRSKISELENILGSSAGSGSSDKVSLSNQGTEDRQASVLAQTQQLQDLLEQRELLQAELDTSREAQAQTEEDLRKMRQSQEDGEEKLRASEARRLHAQDIARADYSEIEESRDKLRTELTALKLHRAKEADPPTLAISHNTSSQEGQHTEEAAETEAPLTKGQKKRKNKKKQPALVKTDIVEHVKQETEKIDDRPSESGGHNYQALLYERNSLRVELETVKVQMESYGENKRSFERKIAQLQEHSETINDMRDMVKDIGNELVDAKDSIKALTVDKLALQKVVEDTRVTLKGLEKDKTLLGAQLAEAKTAEQSAASNVNAQTVRDELEARLAVAEERLRTISRDLEIAEKLSAERFKELSTTKENLKTQYAEVAELKRQATKSTSEKTTLESSLKSTEAKARTLERAEKDRRDELEKSQRNLTSREKELKVIQAAFKEEEVRRKSEESRAAVLKSDVVKLTTLRDSIISSRSELTSQLASMRADLDQANMKMAALQQTKNQLKLERDAAQEELQLGKAKFESSFSLMESQREQTIDMQHRLRETTDRYEAMEEELSEAHRQLTERGREAETLRRLLSEIESGQESRLREMRERMEVAIAERDKAEDEAAFTGKKRAREVEELKETLHDVERAHRKLVGEQQDLLVKLKESDTQMELNKSTFDAKDKDLTELRVAMTELSHTLREAESQISSLEEERGILRQNIKDASHKVDRMTSEITSKDDLLNKLRSEKAHLLDRQDPAQSPTQIRRVSHQRNDSIPSMPGSPAFLRSPSLQSVSLIDKPKEKAEVDREYIKNVLFQFLEHKDKRKYLMPAISKLLLLTKQQEGVFVSSLK